MKRIVLVVTVLVALAAAFVLMGGDPHGGPMVMHTSKVRFDLAADSVSVPLALVDGRVLVDVMLDGKGPFPFVLDTGAHGSVMDLEFAREQGLSLGGEVMVGSPGGAGRPGHMATIGTMAMGDLALHDVVCIAFDGLPFPRTDDSPRGVLSPYSWSGLLITIDYPAQRLIFRRGALPEPDGKEVFGWKRREGLSEIAATVGGIEVPLHLDSGASGGLSLPTALADQLTLDGPLVEVGFAKLVDQVRPLRGQRIKGNFTIGRYTLENPLVDFVDLAKGVGSVGGAVLAQFAITIDPENGRYRLAGPADGKLVSTEVRKPRYGIQVESIETSPVRILVVDAGSPAEKAGLRAGDLIVRMNGHAVEDVTLDERMDALKTSPLAVGVQREGATVDVSMTLE